LEPEDLQQVLRFAAAAVDVSLTQARDARNRLPRTWREVERPHDYRFDFGYYGLRRSTDFSLELGDLQKPQALNVR